MVERIQTGIKGFDDLIQGGLPKGSIVLISGTPGTGKSIFCAQIAYNNALKGKKCLYLNLEQNDNRLQGQMQDFGWDLNKVRNNLKIVAVDSSDTQIVDFVLKEIQSTNYDLIVLDSLDSISSTPVDTDEMNKLGLQKIAESVLPTFFDMQTIGRLKLKKIFDAIAKSKAIALLTAERVEGAQGISRDTISEFLCDGIVLLKHTTLGKNDNRSLEVNKMRSTKILGGSYSFDFKDTGVVVEK